MSFVNVIAWKITKYEGIPVRESRGKGRPENG